MDSSTQTELIQVSHAAVQSFRNRDAQVEATAIEISPQDPSFTESVRSTRSLVEFLHSAEQILIAEITASVRESQELDSLQSNVSNRMLELKINQTHTVYSDHLANRKLGGDDISDNHDFLVSTIEWNCSSSVVMVGYRVKKCENYCQHESYVCLWSLYRRCTRESQPSMTIETQGCISNIASHSCHVSIFAISTSSGHVAVVDSSIGYQGNSSLLAGDKHSHEEGVSFISWISDSSILVSAGYDGNMIIWFYSTENTSLLPMKKYSLLTMHLPKASQKELLVKSNVGISAGHLVSRGQTTCKLFAGCWGGFVLLCSLDWKDCDLSVKPRDVIESNENVVSLSYVAHRSNISSVDVWRRDGLLIASSSLDGELRIYHVNQSKPIALYHFEADIFKISWSLFHPVIYCVVKDTSTLSVIHFNPAEEEENRLIAETTANFARNFSFSLPDFWLNRHSKRQEEIVFARDSGEIELYQVAIL